MTEKSLNQRLAEALGYTVERREGEGESGWSQAFYFVLLSPNGIDMMDDSDDFRGISSEWFTEAEAWQHAPDYENSIDASWEANTDPEGTLSLKREGDQTKAFVNHFSTGEPFAARDKSAARAVALATLKWALWLKKKEKEEREK